MEQEDKEALANYCRAMISSVRHKQQRPQPPRQERTRAERGHTQRTHTGGQVGGDPRQGHQSVPGLMCQGPEVQSVPVQLLAMLRVKTLEEEMRQGADVELHDPAACSACEQQQASLALATFIRRKKTQLRFGRLNTHRAGHFETLTSPSVW